MRDSIQEAHLKLLKDSYQVRTGFYAKDMKFMFEVVDELENEIADLKSQVENAQSREYDLEDKLRVHGGRRVC